jgi:hypothetical protein
VRHYLDTLRAAPIAKVRQPWDKNVRKREVKSPNTYVRDSGLPHALLGVRERRDLEQHPKLGASWEAHLLQQVARHVGAGPEEYFTGKPIPAPGLICSGSVAAAGGFDRTASPWPYSADKWGSRQPSSPVA